MDEGREGSSPVVTPTEKVNKLSIDEAITLFADAGVPRSPRQIRRYCEGGHIESIKLDEQQYRKYSLDRNSTERWIKQLQTIDASGTRPAVSTQDRTRQDPSGRDREEITFLRDQVKKKDEQIDALLERDKETNILIHRLQDTVIALQPPPPDMTRRDRTKDVETGDNATIEPPPDDVK